MLDAQRVETLDNLATERKSSRVHELLSIIESVQKSDATAAGNLARLLPLNRPSDLKSERPRVARLLASASPDIRQPAWAALALADDGFDSVWSQASKSPGALADLLGGIP